MIPAVETTTEVSAETAAQPAASNVLAGAEAVRVPRFPPPALRVRPFRWYWAAQWPVLLGTWMQLVALGYFVLQVTGSPTAVGVVAACQGLPAIVFPLAGGVVADRVPRRRILLVTQSILGVSACSLAVVAFSGHASLATIALVAFVFGSADSVDLPTRQALIGDLVGRELVVSAVALGSVTMSTCRILGPSIAGVLLASVGPGACFLALGLAYIVPISVLLTVIPDIKPLARRAGSSPMGDIAAGLRLALHDPLVRLLVISAATLSFFGVAYMPYLPVLAKTALHGDARVLALMYTTGGVGGLAAGLIIASLARSSTRVRMLAGGGVIYAFSLFTLSHAQLLSVALPALVGISFGFLAMNTSMTTLLQTETDPAMRGRLLGIYTMILAGLQPLGTLFYGLVGHVVPLFDAIGVGALVVGVVAVVAGTRAPLRKIGSLHPATR
jgi:predicted MFS family arabinose efflux permease